MQNIAKNYHQFHLVVSPRKEVPAVIFHRSFFLFIEFLQLSNQLQKWKLLPVYIAPSVCEGYCCMHFQVCYSDGDYYCYGAKRLMWLETVFVLKCCFKNWCSLRLMWNHPMTWKWWSWSLAFLCVCRCFSSAVGCTQARLPHPLCLMVSWT